MRRQFTVGVSCRRRRTQPRAARPSSVIWAWDRTGTLMGRSAAVGTAASHMAPSSVSPRAASNDPSQASDSGLRSEEHTSELQSLAYLVCRLLLEKKKKQYVDAATSRCIGPAT